jgi:hypothetical protein
VRELAVEHRGRIDFKVEPANTPGGLDAAKRFFVGRGHGLVGFDYEGDPIVVMPGHSYAKDDIVAELPSLLPEDD